MKFAWASLCKMPKYRHFSGLWEAAVHNQPDLQQWLTSHRAGTGPTVLAAAERKRTSQLAPLPAPSGLHSGLMFVHKQKHPIPAVNLKFLPSPSQCQEESDFYFASQLLESMSANGWRSGGGKLESMPGSTNTVGTFRMARVMNLIIELLQSWLWEVCQLLLGKYPEVCKLGLCGGQDLGRAGTSVGHTAKDSILHSCHFLQGNWFLSSSDE